MAVQSTLGGHAAADALLTAANAQAVLGMQRGAVFKPTLLPWTLISPLATCEQARGYWPL